MVLQFLDVAMPRIAFGRGRFSELPSHIRHYGRRALILTGGRSLQVTAQWSALLQGLREAGIEWEQQSVTDEPSPQLIDALVNAFHDKAVEVVVGVGGGSVMDAAKAVAGLLPYGNSILDHLEDVGRGIPYHGPALPLIAVPTTAGTGSEATKNAVLSVRGESGFKKSFRHDSLVPRVALVDPDLLTSCPRALIAAQGMDAFTQLLESFVSLRATPFTDALAWSGLEAVKRGFLAAWEGEGEQAAEGRCAMAYAALLSGVTLAQAGLGSVHGLAQPLGSLFPIPHGVACGSVVALATDINVRALEARAPQSPALQKYARVGRLLGDLVPGTPDQAARVRLIRDLAALTDRFGIPRLGAFGVCEADISHIVAGARGNSMKTNPVSLTDEEIAQIVRGRI